MAGSRQHSPSSQSKRNGGYPAIPKPLSKSRKFHLSNSTVGAVGRRRRCRTAPRRPIPRPPRAGTHARSDSRPAHVNERELEQEREPHERCEPYDRRAHAPVGVGGQKGRRDRGREHGSHLDGQVEEHLHRDVARPAARVYEPHRDEEPPVPATSRSRTRHDDPYGTCPKNGRSLRGLPAGALSAMTASPSSISRLNGLNGLHGTVWALVNRSVRRRGARAEM